MIALLEKNLDTPVVKTFSIINKHDCLCFCLPTIEPKTMNALLLTTIHRLASISEYITIAINFQPPYTSAEAYNVVSLFKKMGFCVKYEVNEYPHEKGEVPFNKIRNDCAKLVPNAAIYALLDDDMTFELGENPNIAEQYLSMVYYMLSHTKCGIGVMESDRHFLGMPDTICPTTTDRAFITGKGLLFKSLSKSLFTEDTISLIGCGEEGVLAFSRLKEGMFIALLCGANCKHYENLKNGIEGGGLTFGWADPKVLSRKDSCSKWKTDNGMNNTGCFDKKLYYAAGGLAAEIMEVKERFAKKIEALEFSKRILDDLLKIGGKENDNSN